ncbi:MAG: ATP-dependent helicase C-terminal domain-containing protein, partial [Syntrophales bacterium]|nr:ATP-dependent helicase C-terminal domain-containing protein [Syntrophales bacterium]
LLSAYPDRIAKRRDEGGGRFILTRGRGVRLPKASPLADRPYIIAVHVDAGEKVEGRIHLAESVAEGLLRQEMGGHVETRRRIEWDRQEKRIVSVQEERLDAIVLSSKPCNPTDEETASLISGAIRSASATITFSREVRQFQGRIGLMMRTFPEENWPDLSDEVLLASPEEWLLPWLKGIRTQDQLRGLDILPPLKAQLSWDQGRILDQRAPESIVVPSGHRVAVDHAAADIPVLAVKLQEMFGLADTPVIAGGRMKILLHLLSPARRPVQITQDLRGFWNAGYQQVKKELKGRYPKHPWPDDPWNAVPTRLTTHRK